MKRLYFLRHAKSDWDSGAMSDHERPLNPRGQQDAAKIGRFLVATEQVPELALTSSALRTRKTLELAAAAGGFNLPTRILDALYESSVNRTLHEIRRVEVPCASLLLVGHEPTWSELAGQLIGQANLHMPTAALARIDFEIESWQEVHPGRGCLLWLVTPKILG